MSMTKVSDCLATHTQIGRVAGEHLSCDVYVCRPSSTNEHLRCFVHSRGPFQIDGHTRLFVVLPPFMLGLPLKPQGELACVDDQAMSTSSYYVRATPLPPTLKPSALVLHGRARNPIHAPNGHSPFEHPLVVMLEKGKRRPAISGRLVPPFWRHHPSHLGALINTTTQLRRAVWGSCDAFFGP